MFMKSGSPPLPPLLLNWDAELITHAGDPGHGAGDGNAVVDISRGDPDPESFPDEAGVEPVAGVVELAVVVGDVVGTGVEPAEGDVEGGLDGGLVEEVGNAVHVLTDDVVSHTDCPAAVGKTQSVGLHLLVETLGVEVEHAGVGGVELGISDLPDLHTAGGVIPEPAGSLDVIEHLLSVVPMVVQILILVDAHIDVVSRLVALPRVSAGVVDHDALQVHLVLSRRQPVLRHDVVRQVWNVDTCVALPGEVQLVLAEVGELLEEAGEGAVVVLGGGGVVVFVAAEGAAEADASGGLEVEDVGLHVPGVGVEFEADGALLEGEGPVLVDHAEEAGAAGTAVEPEDEGVVVGVALGVEEDVVEDAGGEVQQTGVPLVLRVGDGDVHLVVSGHAADHCQQDRQHQQIFHQLQHQLPLAKIWGEGKGGQRRGGKRELGGN